MRLLSLQQEMRDLADWIDAQSPMPVDILAAAEHSMDGLSAKALEVCWSITDASGHSIDDVKRKAIALEHLLPEDDEPHLALCRCLCTDIRCL